jgi:hypothetical protein
MSFRLKTFESEPVRPFGVRRSWPFTSLRNSARAAMAPLALAAALVAGAAAQARAQSCPAGYKIAAGACVQSCPGGYEDTGRACVYRRQGGSGGS